MELRIQRRRGFLEVTVRMRRDTVEARAAIQEILAAQQKDGITRMLICVSESPPLFDLQAYKLSDAVARLTGVPGLRVAIVSDTAELFAAHENIARYARERGLDCRAFRSRAEALRWLLPEAAAGASAA